MRVLIADDNQCFRQLLCIPLHACGHEVIVAEDGAEAIALAKCKQPDIILMDVMMPPGMDGFTALRHLKANEATADIPVVLMSAGYIRQPDIERGLALGAADYWKKPFPFEIHDLPKRLEGYLAKKKARATARTHLQQAPIHTQ